jgi:hypothetical protein
VGRDYDHSAAAIFLECEVAEGWQVAHAGCAVWTRLAGARQLESSTRLRPSAPVRARQRPVPVSRNTYTQMQGRAARGPRRRTSGLAAKSRRCAVAEPDGLRALLDGAGLERLEEALDHPSLLHVRLGRQSPHQTPALRGPRRYRLNQSIAALLR